MIELKKSELELILLSISSYSLPKQGEVQTMVGGLLTENITLGTKRKLQKIHKKVEEFYKELIEDVKKIKEACKIGENDKKEPVFDEEKLKKEIEEILEEKVKLDIEPIQISFIEAISTSNNYNFDIIEKFAI